MYANKKESEDTQQCCGLKKEKMRLKSMQEPEVLKHSYHGSIKKLIQTHKT